MQMISIIQKGKFIDMESAMELWANEETNKPFVGSEVFMRRIGKIMIGDFKIKE